MTPTAEKISLIETGQTMQQQQQQQAKSEVIDFIDNKYQLSTRNVNQQTAFLEMLTGVTKKTTRNENKMMKEISMKNIMFESFRKMNRINKLHAISLFRTLAKEEERKLASSSFSPSFLQAADEEETAMSKISFFEKWSNNDQDLFIEMFEKLITNPVNGGGGGGAEEDQKRDEERDEEEHHQHHRHSLRRKLLTTRQTAESTQHQHQQSGLLRRSHSQGFMKVFKKAASK